MGKKNNILKYRYNYLEPIKLIIIVQIPDISKEELRRVDLMSSSRFAHVTSETNKETAITPEIEIIVC